MKPLTIRYASVSQKTDLFCADRDEALNPSFTTSILSYCNIKMIFVKKPVFYIKKT
jgi:hypothetical protein